MEVVKGCECHGNQGRLCCMTHTPSNEINQVTGKPKYAGPAADAPVMMLIERDGRLMAVCSRCYIRGDAYVARLFDGDTDLSAFKSYDSLGAHIIQGLVDDQRWEEFRGERGREAAARLKQRGH